MLNFMLIHFGQNCIGKNHTSLTFISEKKPKYIVIAYITCITCLNRIYNKFDNNYMSFVNFPTGCQQLNFYYLNILITNVYRRKRNNKKVLSG